MPRDSSGNYTLPAGNPVVDGTVIDVNWANPTMDDIAVQLNNVLTRDGLLSPISPFYIVDGTEALPGLAFNSQHGTGLFRPSSGNMGVSVSGVQVVNYGAASTAISNLLSVGDPALAGEVLRIQGANGAESWNVRFGGDTGTNPNIAWQAFNWTTGPAEFHWRVGGLTSADTVMALTPLGNLGIGGKLPRSWGSDYRSLNVYGGQLYSNVSGASSGLFSNYYFDGVDGRYSRDGANAGLTLSSSGIVFYTAASGLEGAVQSITERFRLSADGRVWGTSLHNNAGSVTGTTNQYIASGTYTPAMVAITNVASVTAVQCNWLRVGNVVTVSGFFDVDTVAVGNTLFNIPLPIASNFTGFGNCGGVAVIFAGSGVEADVGRIYADSTNDAAQVNYNSTLATSAGGTFTFTYLVG